MKLITTKDYLLLIDEKAEIKENTWYENNGVLFLSDEKYDDGNNPNNSNPIVTNYNNSVIAYRPRTEDAQELDLPWLPNPFEEDEFTKYYQIVFDYVNSGLRNFGAMMGLLKLKEIVQSKQFSLENMKDILEEGLNWFGGGRDKEIRDSETWFNHYIQSITTQQLPVSFEPEYEIGVYPKTGKQAKRLKTIINSEGKEELVGTYIQ